MEDYGERAFPFPLPPSREVKKRGIDARRKEARRRSEKYRQMFVYVRLDAIREVYRGGVRLYMTVQGWFSGGFSLANAGGPI